ncbi:MAG: squalene/phytoene synthase family protein [Lysobacterales bacterium]|jgi:phytoene synthase
MTAQAENAANPTLFCREQVARTNRQFPVTRLFASTGAAERLLPLYALFSALDQICSDIQEEQVAFSKLHWWREECVVREPAASHHPILRELRRTGAMSSVRKDDIASLLAGAAIRLERKPPADLDQLRQLCEACARPMATLEASITAPETDGDEAFETVPVSRLLVQMFREGSGAVEDGFWWLPLNLLARHGVSRREITGKTASPAARRLVAEVLEAAEEWSGEAAHAARSTPIASARHMWVSEAVSAHKLRTLKSLEPAAFRSGLDRLGMGDAFAAWRAARRFNRR